ncbi:MAG: sigma-70 family RNA polymerase sigma factor [Phycisphaerae bacterium]
MNNRNPSNGKDASPRALACIYDECADKLYRYALMILADASAAEDVVHQVFVKLLKMDHKRENIGSYDHYLRTAVRNECYRIIEKRQNKEIELSAVESILEFTESTASNEEERLIVEKAIRTLPPDQREVVHLKIYEDMTFQQIADLLGISLNTAASRYRYAMDKLRNMLETLKE